MVSPKIFNIVARQIAVNFVVEYSDTSNNRFAKIIAKSAKRDTVDEKTGEEICNNTENIQ